jgi:hypothetical protein
VHQSLLTVPFTALRSLLAAVYHVTIEPRLSRDAAFDALLINGPGTCVVLCLAAYVNRVEFDCLFFCPLAPTQTSALANAPLNPPVHGTAISKTDLCRVFCARPSAFPDGEIPTSRCGQVCLVYTAPIPRSDLSAKIHRAMACLVARWWAWRVPWLARLAFIKVHSAHFLLHAIPNKKNLLSRMAIPCKVSRSRYVAVISKSPSETVQVPDSYPFAVPKLITCDVRGDLSLSYVQILRIYQTVMPACVIALEMSTDRRHIV